MALAGATKMNLIFTMAGRYSRFINEGYKIPKYLLPWGKRSILSEILSIMNHNNTFENIYLVTNKRDDIYMPHVRQILRELNIPIENLFQIDDTKGQAETAYITINKIHDRLNKKPIVFHNIDTILYNREYSSISEILKKKDGHIDVFKSNNQAYSYVLVENNNVQAMAEKVVMSGLATSGLYAFKNTQIFLENYRDEFIYISEVYQHMIDNNMVIGVGRLYDEHDTIVLGTPEQYLNSSYLIDL